MRLLLSFSVAGYAEKSSLRCVMAARKGKGEEDKAWMCAKRNVLREKAKLKLYVLCTSTRYWYSHTLFIFFLSCT